MEAIVKLSDGQSLSLVRPSRSLAVTDILYRFSGFNGADLRNVCTEAGMFAIREERSVPPQAPPPPLAPFPSLSRSSADLSVFSTSTIQGLLPAGGLHEGSEEDAGCEEARDEDGLLGRLDRLYTMCFKGTPSDRKSVV